MRQLALRALLLCSLGCTLAAAAPAQSQSPTPNAEAKRTPPDAAGKPVGVDGSLFGTEAIERRLREQREEIEELRALVKEQTLLVKDLKERVERAERQATAAAQTANAVVVTDAAYTTGATPGAAQGGQLEERVARAEAQAQKAGETIAKQLGSITFSGDIRFRYESFYNQQNALASSDTPGALGNPLTTRQRLRLRARFGARGQIGKEFEWGIRLATGSFADEISSNQTLTDFFNRKPFALDNAYITWKPAALAGFQVQAGKFETPWLRTEMTWDNDNNPEGLTERYTRTFEKAAVRNVEFIAWQLPLLERNSAFVVGADGSVDLSGSRRAGRDLALYGAQVRARLEPSKTVALTLAAADLYFSGTQFVTPVQVFGANVQFPVTVTIPASGETPARTVTAQVSIPRELLVSGNGNLGLSVASTNATNRDGRLASGYNLFDLIARLDLTRSKRWPLMFLFNYVRNTQAHDVVTAGPGGADALLPNDEDGGFWAEFQIGKDVLRLPVERIARGDVVFNYTFLRVGKDAVFSPYNGSDLGLSTDMRVHRFIVGYAADPRISLSLTGFFTQRANGLLGPFAVTPPGSLDRTLTRLQLDTIFRF